MAAIKPTISILDKNDKGIIKVVWNGLDATNNVGTPVRFEPYSDRTVQMNGTFNNVTMVLEGSLEEGGAGTYFTLTDPQGNAISKTSAAGEAVTEIAQYVRPNGSGGGIVSNVTVTLLMRRANPVRQ
jgi:hypothetical protein